MRFDHWSKEKKQMLEYDYQRLFADQIMTLKKHIFSLQKKN